MRNLIATTALAAMLAGCNATSGVAIGATLGALGGGYAGHEITDDNAGIAVGSLLGAVVLGGVGLVIGIAAELRDAAAEDD